VHSHHSKSNLSHVHEYFFGFKFLTPILVQSDFLIETPAICIFHDYVNTIVLDKGFNELNKSGALKNSKELDLIFSTLFVFLIKISEINSFQRIFFTIELISDEID
jgi:hypothetical protein